MNFVKEYGADIPAPSDQGTSRSARQLAPFLREVHGPRGQNPFRHDLAVLAGFAAGLNSSTLATTSIITLAEQGPSAPCACDASAPPLGDSATAWLQPGSGRMAGSARDAPPATAAPWPDPASSDVLLSAPRADRIPLVTGGPTCREWLGNVDLDLFAEHRYAVYSNSVIEVAEGVKTHVVDSTLKCGKGGEFGTALNLDIFIVVWTKVIQDGAYLQNNWTVKADPDSVFFPDRLQAILSIYQEEDNGIYMNNCKFGLHGPIEVSAPARVTSLGKGYKQCRSHFEAKCNGDCMWGEDLFVDQCLWKVLGARRVSDFRLILEDHCDPPEDWQTCNDPVVAAFHPFKNVSSFTQCLQAGRANAPQAHSGGTNPLGDDEEPDEGYCPNDCHNAVEGEDCFKAVQWVMQVGVKDYPEWYAPLSRDSTAEQVQAHLHLKVEAC
ncbi:unnamed protein product [Prorocentrum cordatum]|uniref:Uncharacterized protein n=1 Tax=Prorocentrum cordatum TaxID=2364126 RepID=A0ABN9Y9C2_9DINO|nr:unnamed protein product [Polarella glacialis]